MNRTCEYCKKQFEHKGYKRYCSYDCGQKGYYAKLREVKEKEKCTSRPCAFCQTEFTPVYGHNMRQKFCSQECAGKLRDKEKCDKLRELTKLNPPQSRICEFCKNEFVPTKNNDQKFCSPKCKTDQHSLDQRLENEAIRNSTIKVCPICDKQFNPKKTLKEIYCSPNCRKMIGRKIYKMMSTVYQKCETDKEDHSHEVLGYSAGDLLKHLQSFPDWESLKKGTWHLDHIFPIIAFVRRGIKDATLICALSNLQPLTGPLNCSKNDKYDEQEFEKWIQNNSR